MKNDDVNIKEFKKNFYEISISDTKTDLFEGQYKIEKGVLYNSYVILDKSITVIDSVESSYCSLWLNAIEKILGNKKPDYIIVEHMEPDHSGSLLNFLTKYKECKIIATPLAFSLIDQFFHVNLDNRKILINDKLLINTGDRELSFFTAPMVHWPEVSMVYSKKDAVLFTADAFGKFGIDQTTTDWACEARRYYFSIVGKYGSNVMQLFEKIKDIDIDVIAPLHGPLLSENIPYYVNLYKIWANYENEDKGIVICYSSVYNHTKEAALYLKEEINKKKVDCKIFDVIREENSEILEDCFRYSTIVFATTTYCNSMFPAMKNFISMLTERNLQNKNIAVIENGSWAPQPLKIIKEIFKDSKNINYIEPYITLKSSMSEENKKDIETLANNLISSIK